MVDEVKASFCLPSRTLLIKFLRFAIKAAILAAAFLLLYYIKQLCFDEKLTYHITPDVIAIEDLLTTVYLIKSDDGYILVDTGFDIRIMRKALSINGIDASEIRTLLLTHSDFDHHWNAQLFPQAKIYVSRAEFDMVQSKKRRIFFIPFLHNFLPATELNLVDDGSVVDSGGRKILCVLLSGHTPGSMGYIIDQKYLFSGDAFRLKNGRISLPGKKLLAMDTRLMTQSIRKLKSFTGIQYIFTADSNFTADFNFAMSGW